MRLNKKKLAALAMSAMMAASAMPTTVFAEALLDDGAVVEENAEVVSAAYVGAVSIDKDGKVTVTYSDGTTDSTRYTADKITKNAATCTTPITYVAEVTIDGKLWKEEIKEAGTELGHLPKEKCTKELVTDTYSTCAATGLGHYAYTCPQCNKEVEAYREDGIVIPKSEAHTAGDPVVTYEAVEGKTGENVVITADGAELIDSTLDGWYTKKTTISCKVCGEVIGEPTTEKITLKATDQAVVAKKVGEIDADGNIATASYSAVNNVTASSIKDETLQLKDCAKDGFYWIVSYDKNDKEISRTKHTVTAHHVITVEYKAKNDADATLLAASLVKDKDGKVTDVVNQSCKKPLNI